MRAIVVAMILLGSLPAILMRPWIGILVWSWLSYMNPHRISWGFIQSTPVALIVALATFVGMLMASREEKATMRIPWTRETKLLLIMTLWFFITTVFALFPDAAWPQWDKVWRIMLMTFVTTMLITNEYRLKMLMYTIALSLGFYGLKGGIFVLTTGGAHRVLGPEGTFIAGNNEIGLALIMTVPLLHFMRSQMTNPAIRMGLLAVLGFTVIAVIGTHSRGALLGISAMLMFFLLKSRQKFSAILAVIPLLLVVAYVMPEEWFARMHTIETWRQDGSATERVRAWGNAIDLANERFLGGGMRSLVWWGGRDSHSIYFGMLGENGWVGLGMFLLLLFFTWRSASWVIRNAKPHPELHWARDLAAMIQVSLVGYMSAGAFLGLQYFDLFYHLVVIVVIARQLVENRLRELEGERAGKGSVAPFAPVPASTLANGIGPGPQGDSWQPGGRPPGRPFYPGRS